MKILAIRGKNLASLEGEFEIDFRKEPLRSAGIYAITGSTGSGKSTLLDAMCIALFNNSPRINNVTDNADITDVSTQTIKEKDCRNIMRRGCTDAYAEVDFRALSGKEFRARWSVRRSRDKHDGKLQDYTYSLYNISDSHEEQGVKTELLAKVRELIGLTFEQFTRAVLLAQGEFATFLKAPSRNKAEILEKLTGTDIYSKISIRIHEKRKEAENQLYLAEEKIKGIELLDEEQKKTLKEEQKKLRDKHKELEETIKLLTAKQKWFERKRVLDEEQKKAEEEINRILISIENSTPIIEQLKQTESIEEIRDTYNQILLCKRNITENKQQAEQLRQQCTGKKEELDTAEKRVSKLLEEQTEANNEWNSLQPKIKEAMHIESECLEKRKILDEAIKETYTIEKQYNDEEKTKKENETNIKTCEAELKREKEWFDEHQTYESVIPKADIIIANIADIKEAEREIAEKNKLISEAKEQVAKQEELLKEEEKAAERLKTTLSTEIATLRARLVEGEPCPVCGSIHHVTTATSSNTLHEEELHKAKNNIEENISHITKSLENSRNEITRLQASIESYTAIRAERYKKLSEMLNGIIELQSTENESLAKLLKETADEWEKRNNKTAKLNEQLTVSNIALENSNKACEELKKRINEKKAQIASMQQEYEKRHNSLQTILGKFSSAEQLEENHKKRISYINESVTKAIEERNSILLAVERNEALLEECNTRDKKLNEEFSNLKTAIEEFLKRRNDNLQLEELHRLATTSVDDIRQMRKKIEEVKTNEAKARATLQERIRNSKEHEKADNRPLNEETTESIETLANEKSKEINEIQQQLSEIEVRFRNDENNSIKYKKYKSEYEKTAEKAENWRKLYELFGSADGAKFKVMAQGYTLDILLGYANKHLKEISQRYQLARVSGNTLSIKVIDLDMMSETRSVHSLSGGESFLISLALALALSSLSSNRMSIESLFIDEGFGSLDSDTLRIAMEALEKLQNQGRKIGVISHLHEMIERIPTQIKIVKYASGRSKVVI